MHVRALRTLLVLACVWLLPAADAGAAAVVVAVEADMISDDPARTTRHGVTDMIHGLIYEPLITPEPWGYGRALASSVRQVSASEWEFTVDGARGVDAQAVAEALRRAYLPQGLAGETAPARERLAVISDIEATEDGRVMVRLQQPLPSFPTLISREYVAVPHGAGLLGTGPYALAEWIHGNRIILVRKDPAGPEALLPERVVFEVIPSRAQRVAAFLSGRVDVLPGVTWDEVPQLRTLAGVQLLRRPGTRSRFIELNTNVPPFNDVRVRLALNLAVDVQAVLDEVYGGFGIPLPTIVTPRTVGYAEGLTPLPYDPERARELLAAAGYPRGFDFELDVTPDRLDEARAIARYWEAVGVTVHLRVWPDWPTLRAVLLQGGRMAWTAEWNNTSLDPGSMLWAKVGTGGSANYGRYSDAVVDRLLREAEQAVTIEERIEKYRAVQVRLYEQAVMVFGYAEEEVTAVRPGVSLGPLRLR